MKLAIIILHYLKKDLTSQCLESVKRLDKKGFELQTVVVNNSPEEDLLDAEKNFKEVEFLETEKNLGFTGGNNLGIRYALKNQADFIMLLNNDTLIDQSALVQLIKVASLIDQSGILGPKIYFAPGYEYHQEKYRPEDQGKVIWYAGGVIDWKNILASHRGVDEVDRGQYNRLMDTGFVSGCSMLVKKEVFEKIGLLDERYFLYLEDLDFCQRAKRGGFKILYVPEAKIWHFNAGSSEVGGPLHDYFFTRNRMFFGMKYASARAKIALLRESVRLLRNGREWQKRGILDFYLRKFGRGTWPES